MITSADAHPALAGRIPELMVSSLGKGPFFTEADSEGALEKAKAYDVIALGPGLGREKETGKFVKRLITSFDKTMVIDADALLQSRKSTLPWIHVPGGSSLRPM